MSTEEGPPSEAELAGPGADRLEVDFLLSSCRIRLVHDPSLPEEVRQLMRRIAGQVKMIPGKFGMGPDPFDAELDDLSRA